MQQLVPRDLPHVDSLRRLVGSMRQERAYARLLDDILKRSDGRIPGSVASRLASRRAQRRALRREHLHVVGFGARQWEQFGLWQAFEAESDFHLSLYGDGQVRSIGADEDGDARRASHRDGFLAFVAEREKHNPVDLAFFYASGEHIDPSLLDALHARGIWTVMMGLDDKHQFTRPMSADGQSFQLRAAARCDLYWTTWHLGAAWVAAHGGNPWVAPEAADPEFHRLSALPRDLDVVFVGAAYGRRLELVRYLRARGIAVHAVGKGWPDGPVDFATTIELFNRAHVVLGMGDVGHMQGVKHLKGRDFEVPMTGALYLTTFNDELAGYFDIGREILCYGSYAECAEIVVRMLRAPEAAQAVRTAGRVRALRDHTWRRRIADLFDALATG